VEISRLKSDDGGFGLIELVIAMAVLNIGLLAIVAAFSSGAVALKRSGNVATAATLANQQLEIYRALPYGAIGLDTAAAPTPGASVNEAAPPTGPCQTGQSTTCGNTAPDGTGPPAFSCASSNPGGSFVWVPGSFPNACTPSRSVSGGSSPDRHNYQVDTYIRKTTQTSQRETKTVTVVVRDGSKPNGRALARVQSTFDCSTGQVPGLAYC
jgi:type II secretory pathway pseudopilin PulG